MGLKVGTNHRDAPLGSWIGLSSESQSILGHLPLGSIEDTMHIAKKLAFEIEVTRHIIKTLPSRI